SRAGRDVWTTTHLPKYRVDCTGRRCRLERDSQRPAAISSERTSSAGGLVRTRPSMTTVGTVSLPSLWLRTKAAASASCQILIQVADLPTVPSRRRNAAQYMHPGRQ